MVAGAGGIILIPWPLPLSREFIVLELNVLKSQEQQRHSRFVQEFYCSYGKKAPDQFVVLLMEPYLQQRILHLVDMRSLGRLMATCSTLWQLLKYRLPAPNLVEVWIWREFAKQERAVPKVKLDWLKFQNDIQYLENQLARLPIVTKSTRKQCRKGQLSDREWKAQKRAWKTCKK